MFWRWEKQDLKCFQRLVRKSFDYRNIDFTFRARFQLVFFLRIYRRYIRRAKSIGATDMELSHRNTVMILIEKGHSSEVQ